MIKRFLAYCLMVSMLIGNVSVFSSENDYEGTNYEIPTKVLNTFNIISLNEDGNLNVGSKISRAEFAVMIAKALGADLNLPQSGEVYSDLKKGTDAYNAVVIVSKLGIVSGYGDGTFRPYDSITFEQAASMLTKMIGYKLMVDAKGGYPVGCLAVASETGILKGVDISSGQVTNANAVLMLYNAMCADMFKQTQFGTNEKYSVSKDVNVFSEYLGVSKKKGIVTENDKTSLIGESKISKGEVTISGVVYNAGKSGIEKYLGYCVEFFATADDEQNEILLAYAVESENNVETIEAENLSIENSSLAKGYFSYFDENDKIKKVYVSKEVDVIYNSRAYPSFKESDFDITVGELVFMDNNNDGYAEIILINEYLNYTISGTDKSLRKIYSMNNEVFTIQDDAEYEFYTDKGEKIDISDLIADWTVSIYESRNGKYVKGIVSTKTVTGIIDELNSGDGLGVTLNGQTYESSKLLSMQGENSDLQVGKTIKLYIDSKNQIAGFSEILGQQSLEYTYGYLIKAQSKLGLSNEAQLRVFTKSGEFVNFEVSSKIEFNGSKTNTDGKKYTPVSVVKSSQFYDGGNFKPQLIKYKLNSNNEISSIYNAVSNESPLGFDNEKFTLDYSANAVYRDIPRMFGSSYIINNDTIMFNIPVAENGVIEEDECSVLTTGRFEGNTLYPVALYDSNSSRIASALVTSHFSSLEYTRWGLIVDRITKVESEENGVVTKLYGFMNGKKSEYEFTKSSSETNNIQKGDILQLMLNSKNMIVGYKYLFNYKTEVFPSIMSANPGGILVGVYGKVLSKEKGCMTVVVADNKVYPFVFSTYTRVYLVDRTDPNRITIDVASSEEIIPTGKINENINISNMTSSKVYVNRRYDNAYDIVIIKD